MRTYIGKCFEKSLVALVCLGIVAEGGERGCGGGVGEWGSGWMGECLIYGSC